MKTTALLLFLHAIVAEDTLRVGIIGPSTLQGFVLDSDVLNVSIIEHEHISLPLGKPFAFRYTETTHKLNSYEALLAPEENCSTIQIYLRHFGHHDKIVTCFRSPLKSARDLFPPALLYSLSIVSVVHRLKWTSVIIIGDNDNEIWSLSEELSASGILCLTFTYSSSDTPDMIMNMTRTALSTDRGFPMNFIVLGQETEIHSILKVASDFDVHNKRRTDMRSSSQWLVIMTEGDMELFRTLGWLDNVAVMTYPGLSADWYQSNPSHCQGKMYTLMYRDNGRELEHTGTFDCTGNVECRGALLPNLNYGFNGRLFVASTMRWPPFTFVKNVSGVLEFEGLCVDMLQELSIRMNFTFKVKIPVDGEWGLENEAGVWSGMVGELQRNEIDLTVAALTISSSRLKVMDFTYPFGYDKGVGVYRIPDPDATRWKTLIFPFTWPVHMCIGISFVACTLFLYGLQWAYRHILKPDIIDTGLLVFGMFIRYSYDVKSVSVATSFFISFVWLFGTVCTAIYCGNMIAFFAVAKDTLPFQTIPEVAAQDTYTWGTQGGTFWVNIFQFSNNSDYKKMWQGMKRFNLTDPDVLHKDELLQKEKVERGNYVFFVEADMLKQWAEQNCDLRLLQDSVYQVRYGVGLPKDSPYTKQFSQRLVSFSEEGLFVAWRRKWWKGEDLCADRRNINTKVISVEDLQSAFYVLIIGIVIGLGVIIYEVSVNQWRICKNLRV